MTRIPVRNKTCKECGKTRRIWRDGKCYWCAGKDDQVIQTTKMNRQRNNLKKKKRKKQKDDLWTEVRKCDRAFSMLVRILDTDKHGYVRCYTCNYKGFWKRSKIQCGHFIGRTYFATRWLLKNAKPQCKECNENLKGNLEVYERNLIQEYDDSIITYLNKKSLEVNSITTSEVRDIRLHIERKLKDIRELKGF